MRKPTRKMMTVLRDLREGRGSHHDCNGQSEYGGRSTVLFALRRRGLIDQEHAVTPKGISALLAEEASQ